MIPLYIENGQTANGFAGYCHHLYCGDVLIIDHDPLLLLLSSRLQPMVNIVGGDCDAANTF